MAAAVMAAPASVARADEDPGRGVARISLINGDVSVRRGDTGDWVAAAVNAPLVVEDAIATGSGSRAEVQFDYANMIRLGPDAEVRLVELENNRYQMQVARGTVVLRQLRNSEADVDVSTPAVSVRPRKKGAYRIAVREDGETEITVRSGEVEVYTPSGVERLGSGRAMVVRSSAAGPEFQMADAAPRDEFDAWNEQRDRSLERTNSYRYVSPSIYGADDLDGHGRWVYDAPYGWVWVPSMGPGWAPYSHGRWTWQDWYGWTWVSYDPWGWAPYHYGRWYNSRWGWSWYPGGMGRHYWRPALVAFFGFGAGNVHAGFGFGRVGWVPLAPHEPYYPWYGRSYYSGYRGGYVDRSVRVTNVNIYKSYRNARVHNAVSGIDAGNFGRGRHDIVRVGRDDIDRAGLVRGQLPLAPDRSSLRLADREVRGVPRSAGNTQFFSRRQAAAVERVPFAEQQRSFERVAGSRPADAAGAPAGGRGGEMRRAAENQPVRTDSGAGGRDGWRRVGEPAQAGQQVRGEGTGATASPNRGAETNRNADGWRRPANGGARVGAPAAQSGESGESGPAARPAEQPRRQPAEGGNWRRFGEPSQRQEGRRPAVAPRSNEAPRQVEQPRQREQAPRPEVQEKRRDQAEGGRSWQSFGDPQRSGFSSESAASRGGRTEAPASGDSRRQESLSLGAPVVRERSMPRAENASRTESAPRTERTPRMESAPRVERAPRMENAPRTSSGGGGSRGEARSGGGGHSGRDGGRR